MSTYDLLLTKLGFITVCAVLVSILVSVTVTKGRHWISVFLFNFGPAFAVAFYITVIIFGDKSSVDIFSVLFLELINFFLIASVFYKLKSSLTSAVNIDWHRAVKRTLLLQIILFAPLLTNSDFGLFSKGSRVDYLTTGILAKYLTYGGVLTAAVLAVVIAGSMNKGSISRFSLLAIILNVVMSLLAGSKGGVFLWIVSIFALADLKRFYFFNAKFVMFFLLVISSIIWTLFVMAKNLGLDIYLLIKLIKYRFFLSNDARALAIDFRESLFGTADFLNEAFRSFAKIFGANLHELPLGVRLYSKGLLIKNGNGANTGLTPLIISYFEKGYALLPALLFMILSFIMYSLVERVFCKGKSVKKKLYLRALLLQLLIIFMQDFLAFLVAMPMFIIFSIFILSRGKQSQNA